MLSQVATILDFQVFRFYPNLNYNTENDEKTAFTDLNLHNNLDVW